jgi:hypothetical protein
MPVWRSRRKTFPPKVVAESELLLEALILLGGERPGESAERGSPSRDGRLTFYFS